VFAFVILGDGEGGAVPVLGAGEALGNLVGAVVFAVERLGVDLVVDERGQDGARDGSGIPVARGEGGGGDLSSGLGDLGGVLELPVGGELEGRR
jgi:hypothetical protein